MYCIFKMAPHYLLDTRTIYQRVRDWVCSLFSSKQKANEVGISLRALAKTRHLYKYIKKSPRKFLYFEEDPREAIRPNIDPSSVGSVKRRSRRRDVPFGETNYHKAPSGSGNSLQLLNQMRAKAALEGKVKPGEIQSLTEAMTIKIKDNHKEIVEQKRAQKIAEIQQQDERQRRKDPRRYGHFNPRGRVIDLRTNWNEIFPREKDEYDLALEELGENSSEKEYYDN